MNSVFPVRLLTTTIPFLPHSALSPMFFRLFFLTQTCTHIPPPYALRLSPSPSCITPFPFSLCFSSQCPRTPTRSPSIRLRPRRSSRKPRPTRTRSPTHMSTRMLRPIPTIDQRTQMQMQTRRPHFVRFREPATASATRASYPPLGKKYKRPSSLTSHSTLPHNVSVTRKRKEKRVTLEKASIALHKTHRIQHRLRMVQSGLVAGVLNPFRDGQ